MGNVLIVDDNRSVCQALELLLSINDIDAESVHSPEAALARTGRGDVDLVIQDMNFQCDTTSGEEGVALFHALRKHDPELPIILLTAWAQLETAVELVRHGAADYQRKPWDDDKLITTVHNLLALRQSRQTTARLRDARSLARRELEDQFDLCGLVYRSDAMHELVSIACRVAKADVPVLITGPSGSGKEKIAEIVQRNSRRAGKPFIRVNVGALPTELIASELFGAVAGAYTGSTKAREGHFQAANGGTLFLDEIGTLPADGQVKLLRVLQSGEFQRLGSSATQRADVRIISATNADIEAQIRAGSFREDLYYRLNMIELRIPALAQRKDDIDLLADAFLDDTHHLNEASHRALQRHSWPGNIRELENVIGRACLLAAEAEIQPADLALESPASLTDSDLDEAALRDLLQKHRGVIAAAARESGMSRQALYRRMEKFGLHATQNKPDTSTE